MQATFRASKHTALSARIRSLLLLTVMLPSLLGWSILYSNASAAPGSRAFLPVIFGPQQQTVITGKTYYVDCTAGNDNFSGTTTSQAWKTIAKANKALLAPGDRLLFKRGCTWNGPLEASWRGTSTATILIGAYGSGNIPIIQNSYSVNVRITGTYLVIENLHATYPTAPNPDRNCGNQPVGWKLGFNFTNGASYNRLRNSKATRSAIGIALDDNSHHNIIHNNTITDNNVVWEHNANGDLGAMGMSLHGNDNEIAYNYFANNKAICSYTSTIESNTIEIYKAKRNYIHHNVAFGDRVFSELGSTSTVRSEYNVIAYNLHVTGHSAKSGDSTSKGARFITTRGEGHPYGPVWYTKVYNNTVYYTGLDSSGITCEYCGPHILILKNNVIVVKQKAVFIGPSGAGQYQPDESNNLYWTPSGGTFPSNFLQNLVTDSTIIRSAPQFVNPSTDPAVDNFRLRSASPAINKGVYGSGYRTDLVGIPVPQGNGIDLGPYEFSTTATGASIWDVSWDTTSEESMASNFVPEILIPLEDPSLLVTETLTTPMPDPSLLLTETLTVTAPVSPTLITPSAAYPAP